MPTSSWACGADPGFHGHAHEDVGMASGGLLVGNSEKTAVYGSFNGIEAKAYPTRSEAPFLLVPVIASRSRPSEPRRVGPGRDARPSSDSLPPPRSRSHWLGG